MLDFHCKHCFNTHIIEQSLSNDNINELYNELIKELFKYRNEYVNISPPNFYAYKDVVFDDPSQLLIFYQVADPFKGLGRDEVRRRFIVVQNGTKFYKNHYFYIL